MESWIKLPREIRKCDWYEKPILKSVYLELLLIANWKETHWQGIDLKPGDAVTGRLSLAMKLGLSEQNVRTALKTLEKWGYITRTTTNQYTIVHIKDFHKFQNVSESIEKNEEDVFHEGLLSTHIKTLTPSGFGSCF